MIKTVLGMETSCDETAVAIYDAERGLLAHRIDSQTALHQQYGGVVPELASRDHIRKTLPLIQQCMQEASLSSKDIHGIAYTQGPGLIGALMVGAAIAKSLAYTWQIPSIGVHHMESHLLAVCLESDFPAFPFLALLVSGGHTMLIHVRARGNYLLLGETLDDAAGEAFDKTAKLLGLSYPGGPALAALATHGRPKRFHFPRPMQRRADLHFSFSGLKTHALRCVKTSADDEQTRADIAYAFEEAVVDTLLHKCRQALERTGLRALVIVGGVAANEKLRTRAKAYLESQGVRVYYPRFEFCTDNGAMVAYNGWLRLSAGEREALVIHVRARWPMNELVG